MSQPCVPDILPPPPLSYFTSVVTGILSVFISLSNAAILAAIIKDPFKNLRKPFGFFLANIAAADLIVGTITMPIASAVHALEALEQLKPVHTTVVHLTFFVSAASSVLSMIALCMDRHLTLSAVIVHRRKLSRRRCFGIIFAIWTTSIAFSITYLWLGYVTMLLLFLHISLVTTFGISLLTYVTVVRRVRTLARSLSSFSDLAFSADSPNTSDFHSKRRRRRERHITEAFLVILVTLVCIYLPSIVCAYILQFCIDCDCDIRHVLRDVCFILIASCSAINPIVCYFRLNTIKKAIHATIKCSKISILDLKSFRSVTRQEPEAVVGLAKWKYRVEELRISSLIGVKNEGLIQEDEVAF